MKYQIYIVIFIVLFVILLCIMLYNIINKYKFKDIIQKQEIARINLKTFGDFYVIKLDNLLSIEECNYLINLAKNKGLEDSTVYQNKLVVDETHRKSKQAWFYDDDNEIVKKISNIASKLSNYPVENQEQLQIVKYDKGGMFNEHFDACDSNKCSKSFEKSGQRLFTLLIYLNDAKEFEGGETKFTVINETIKPKIGMGIFFNNVAEDQFRAHPLSKHAGLPLRSGSKWICNKWIHPLPYNN